MQNEEKIKEDLTKKFSFLSEKIIIQRARRLWVEVSEDHFFEVFDHLYHVMGFKILNTITGLDDGPNLTILYHLAHPEGQVLTLKKSVSKENPVLKTIFPYFPGGEIYERELVDLLGAKVEGLPPGNRYPLPDAFPTDQHPLRKDWKGTTAEAIAGDCKGGCK